MLQYSIMHQSIKLSMSNAPILYHAQIAFKSSTRNTQVLCDAYLVKSSASCALVWLVFTQVDDDLFQLKFTQLNQIGTLTSCFLI